MSEKELSTKEVPEGFKLLVEGQARILCHVKETAKDQPMPDQEEEVKGKNGKKKKMNKEAKDGEREAVFYNPVQEFNRDLSILCITEYGAQLQKVRFGYQGHNRVIP
jgi:tRNA G26 N,N-dimethylase Trm1